MISYFNGLAAIVTYGPPQGEQIVSIFFAILVGVFKICAEQIRRPKKNNDQILVSPLEQDQGTLSSFPLQPQKQLPQPAKQPANHPMEYTQGASCRNTPETTPRTIHRNTPKLEKLRGPQHAGSTRGSTHFRDVVFVQCVYEAT